MRMLAKLNQMARRRQATIALRRARVYLAEGALGPAEVEINRVLGLGPDASVPGELEAVRADYKRQYNSISVNKLPRPK